MKSNNNYKENERRESDGVRGVGNFRLYGRTFYDFNEKKEKPSAIKRGNGKHIDDGEIYGNERGETEEVYKTEMVGVPYHAHNPDGTRNGGQVAFSEYRIMKQTVETLECFAGIFDG
jgi:hypothetical protein